MPRTRTAAGSRRGPRTADSPLLETADRMVSQIEALVGELAAVRAENEILRDELRGAVDMFERASAVLGSADGVHRGRRARVAAEPRGRGRRSIGRRTSSRRGRATPSEVTPQVIRATLGKLGPSTAAEIAAAISEAGVQVSGRAVRFLAERAGAEVSIGEDGQRRYRL